MCIHSINLLHIIDIYYTQKLIDDRLKVRPSLIQDGFRGRPLGRLVCTWSRVTRFLHELFFPAKIPSKSQKKGEKKKWFWNGRKNYIGFLSWHVFVDQRVCISNVSRDVLFDPKARRRDNTMREFSEYVLPARAFLGGLHIEIK